MHGTIICAVSPPVTPGRIQVPAASTVDPPPIENSADVLESFLSDAAHVPGGFAAGVAFPRSAGEAAALIRSARRLLPVGAQSSLTGGATPRGDIVIGTRALNEITVLSGPRVRAGAGVPLSELQRVLAGHGLYYPPVPTYDGAFVGGTIATNAAGPATFKYGSTRRWVDALTVVLANGSVVEIRRGEITASPDGSFELEFASGHVVRVPVPTYEMPEVAKLSAGYYGRPGMDLIDLFIGSEGTLAFVTNATLRVVPLPRRCVALVEFESDAQAVRLTAALRERAAPRVQGSPALDVSAVEFMDSRALALLPDEVFARANVSRPPRGSGFLLVQIEVDGEGTEALTQLDEVLAACTVAREPYVTLPGDDRGAARLFALREAVPASLNAQIAATKMRLQQDIEKTAGDVVVPFDRLEESLAMYRSTFEQYGLEYAIWGHVSDGNMHPNVVPRSMEDVHRGRSAILEIARGVMALGGAPLAEHGVGRSALKQQMLRELYGDRGIDEMRAVKRALDPEWKLASGVLFPP
jgi:D-lactate dehydrogenase (cytochrome)